MRYLRQPLFVGWIAIVLVLAILLAAAYHRGEITKPRAAGPTMSSAVAISSVRVSMAGLSEAAVAGGGRWTTAAKSVEDKAEVAAAGRAGTRDQALFAQVEDAAKAAQAGGDSKARWAELAAIVAAIDHATIGR